MPSEFEKTFQNGKLYSLPELTKKYKNVARLPVSLRIVLESLLRNTDGKRVRDSDVETLAGWRPKAERTGGVAFVVARWLLQALKGLPMFVNLAAMRSAVKRSGGEPKLV